MLDLHYVVYYLLKIIYIQLTLEIVDVLYQIMELHKDLLVIIKL